MIIMVEQYASSPNYEKASAVIGRIIAELLQRDGFLLDSRVITVDEFASKQIGVSSLQVSEKGISVHLNDDEEYVFRTVGASIDKEGKTTIIKTAVDRDVDAERELDSKYELAHREYDTVLDQGHAKGYIHKDEYLQNKQDRVERVIENITQHALALELKDQDLAKRISDENGRELQAVTNATNAADLSDSPWHNSLVEIESRLAVLATERMRIVGSYSKSAMDQVTESFDNGEELTEVDAWSMSVLIDKAVSAEKK